MGCYIKVNPYNSPVLVKGCQATIDRDFRHQGRCMYNHYTPKIHSALNNQRAQAKLAARYRYLFRLPHFG